MDGLHEVRRKNFLSILAESREMRGLRRGDVAKMIGQKPEYISHVTNPDPKKRRVINEDMARRIEQAFNKPRYWMDGPHAPVDRMATTDAITTAIRAAQDAMRGFAGRTFTADEESKIFKVAIETALRQPLTESQFKVIIDQFIVQQD